MSQFDRTAKVIKDWVKGLESRVIYDLDNLVLDFGITDLKDYTDAA